MQRRVLCDIKKIICIRELSVFVYFIEFRIIINPLSRIKVTYYVFILILFFVASLHYSRLPRVFPLITEFLLKYIFFPFRSERNILMSINNSICRDYKWCTMNIYVYIDKVSGLVCG